MSGKNEIFGAFGGQRKDAYANEPLVGFRELNGLCLQEPSSLWKYW